MNWTAVIVTFMICGTALVLADRMRGIAKIWLDGLKTIRDTEAMRHGYQPRGGASR